MKTPQLVLVGVFFINEVVWKFPSVDVTILENLVDNYLF